MDNRKKWMRELQAIKFSRDGLMTQETAREQRYANEARARCVHLSRDLDALPSHLKEESLGRKWSQILEREGFTTYGNA
jgi:hypothetical protein